MQSYEINIITDNPKSATQYNQVASTGVEFDNKVKQDVDNAKLVQVAIIGLAKRAANDVVSRIGEYTGKRAVQQRVDNVNKFVGVGLNIFLGFKVGGVYGAIAGAAVSGYQYGIEIIDSNRNIIEEEQKRTYLRNLYGNINSYNRSNGNL